jgi:nitroreductase
VNGQRELEKVLRERRSVRRFAAKPVPRDLVMRVLESATWAPSPGNRQSWTFTAVVSGDVKRQMAKAVGEAWRRVTDAAGESGVAEELRAYCANFDWFAAAPVVVVVSARGADGFLQDWVGERATDVSGNQAAAAMAAQNMMLAAHASGLGTCCLTGPLAAHDEIKRLLGLGPRQALVCLVAMGCPDEQPVPAPRKPVNEVSRVVE